MTDTRPQLTIETLEQMFVYLGCANLPTQAAMDGAVPLESLFGSDPSVSASCFEMAKIPSMPAEWNTKAVWFSGDNLGLSTAENIHWSRMSHEVWSMMKSLEVLGHNRKRKMFTEDADGFVRLFYSEIDRYGRFIKFPVNKKYTAGVAVKKLFNPSWLFFFGNESMQCISSSSDAIYREKRLSFLAPFLCGLAQSIGSYWLVKTRFDDICPSLTLLTDPTGVKEFWKLRDVPPGRTRRAALLHWVDQHWRQMRSDPDVETFVRAHMRGQSEIVQGSFQATITPSVNDTVDEEAAIAQRAEMRKRKRDRRRRRTLLTKIRAR